jgi:hypothetical protein
LEGKDISYTVLYSNVRAYKKNKRRPEGRARSRRVPTRRSPPRFIILAIVVMIAIAVAGTAYFVFFMHGSNVVATTSSTSTQGNNKWKILYVNQGNGVVNESNFGAMLSTTKSHGFNAVFFQIYRSGNLLFTTDQLRYFVSTSQIENISIFFALYFTSSSQQIPSQIYGLGENGISLDMSTLPFQTQQILFSTLQQNYQDGKIAITTTDFTLNLRPDLLILETYDFSADKQYIHSGIISSVEPLATQSKQDYETQFDYALSNSDGVMVFDYYGLTTKGY